MRRDELTVPVDQLSLAGEWNFRLDPAGQGILKTWFELELDGKAFLPGTTTSSHLGPASAEGEYGLSSQDRAQSGPVWFQRSFVLPRHWHHRRVFLFLERVRWESQVWVSPAQGPACYAGRQASQAAPHQYDLSGLLQEGQNRITIRVDPPPRLPAAADGVQTPTCCCQTGWSGILGKIELRARDRVAFESVQVYPDASQKNVRLALEISNTSGSPATVDLHIQVHAQGEFLLARDRISQEELNLVLETHVKVSPRDITRASYCLNLGTDARLWDVNQPALYRARISLSCRVEDQIFSDSTEVVFGIRELKRGGTQLALNGRTVFLRGAADSAQPPLSTPPATDEETWVKRFETARNFGLNLVRFAGWCPPEAAFTAADGLGMWLHVELPVQAGVWPGSPSEPVPFLQAELERILAAYGSHPSFLSLALNIPHAPENSPGDQPFPAESLAKWVRFAQELDPRHLYTRSNPLYPPSGPDDFAIGPWGEQPARLLNRGSWSKSKASRASPADNHLAEIIPAIRTGPEAIQSPLLIHEVRQWAAYPNLAEIARGPGMLQSRGLERIQRSLEKHGLLDQVDEFALASGRLNQILYREAIETALRTPGLAGFLLPGLRDEPDLDFSRVGWLNAFCEPKGLTLPDVFRRSCTDSAILLRMPSRVYTHSEVFQARAEIARYAAAPIPDIRPSWSLKDASGNLLERGELPLQTIAPGGLQDMGSISFSLQNVAVPARLSISLSLAGTGLHNEWDLWVYPDQLEDPFFNSVLIAQEWSPLLQDVLVAGGKVLLLPHLDSLPGSSPGSFMPRLESGLDRGGPNGQTLGFLCEPSHPAFAHFPTEFHSNWQWCDLAERSRALNLDRLPISFRPLVQVIDSCESNHKLGVVFQAQVGKGRLVVSSIDLANDLGRRPVARQLRYSLLSYMNGDRFSPAHELPLDILAELLGLAA